MLRLTSIVIVTALLPGQQRPPTPPVTAHTIRSSSVPASDLAVVTYMVKGHAEQSSDLLFVIWRGQARWYRGAPRSSSGGGSGASFSATATYGAVRIDLEVDLTTRVANVQGIRVELGDANVVLVDDVDRPKITKVVKTLRVDASGQLGPSPDAPLRLLGSSPEIVDFLGCGQPEPGSPEAVPGFCWMVVGRTGKQE